MKVIWKMAAVAVVTVFVGGFAFAKDSPKEVKGDKKNGLNDKIEAAQKIAPDKQKKDQKDKNFESGKNLGKNNQPESGDNKKLKKNLETDKKPQNNKSGKDNEFDRASVTASVKGIDKDKGADNLKLGLRIKVGNFDISAFDRQHNYNSGAVAVRFVYHDDWNKYCSVNNRAPYLHHDWQKCACGFCSFYRHRHLPAYNPVQSLLLTLKYDHDDNDRGKAAEKLGDLKALSAIDALTFSMFHDPEDDVRRMCAKSLGRIGSSDSINPLAYAMTHDPAEKVRKAARRAIEKIEDNGFGHYYGDEEYDD